MFYKQMFYSAIVMSILLSVHRYLIIDSETFDGGAGPILETKGSVPNLQKKGNTM